MHVERILHDPSVFSKIKPSLDHFLRSVVLPELLTHTIKMVKLKERTMLLLL